MHRHSAEDDALRAAPNENQLRRAWLGARIRYMAEESPLYMMTGRIIEVHGYRETATVQFDGAYSVPFSGLPLKYMQPLLGASS